MAKNPQSRKWQITINNPAEKNLGHTQIKERLCTLKSAIFFCMADELGIEETPHTHIYLVCSSPVRFSTLHKLFGGMAHLEAAKGSHKENCDYIAKDGKWKDDKKHSTKIDGSYETWGELSNEVRGHSVESKIVSRIQAGATNAEILLDFPQYLRGLRDVEYARQMLRAAEFRNKWRELQTTYIFGNTGLGKTRYVMDHYGYANVFHINEYRHPFDGYCGEPVVLFDEFCSNFPIQQMNNFLDGYPLTLPARYSNKQACYEIVFIVSNLDLREQYRHEQIYQRSVWDAFTRRIHSVIHFQPDGSHRQYKTQDYLSGADTWTDLS